MGAMTIGTDGSSQVTFREFFIVDTIQGLSIIIKMTAHAQLVLSDVIFPAIGDFKLGVGITSDGTVAIRTQQFISMNGRHINLGVDIKR